jgi:hypothetical protein
MTGSPNAFGIEPRYVDDDTARRAVANAPSLAAQIDAFHARASRDAAIAVASGRWQVGRPDPDIYRPGDAVAIRSIGLGADLVVQRRNLALLRVRPADVIQAELQLNAASGIHLALSEYRALYDAVPHWLDGPTAAGVIDSTPPAPDVLAEVRLPYPRILVCFEHRFDLPAELADWPHTWDHTPDLSTPGRYQRSSLGNLRHLGGALEGVVLTERPGGGIADEVLWLVSANPDPSLPMPLAADRYRAMIWGRLPSAGLAHVAHNLAAAISWAEWRQPARSLRLPDDVGSRLWRKAVRRGDFRRHEPHGAAAGVHVIDLKRSAVQRDRLRSSTPEADAHRRSPAAHLRRAHWRLQPVGPGRTQRRLVRVTATVVNPGVAMPASPIYRVPMPDGNPAAQPGASEPSSAAHEPPPAPDLDLRTLPLRPQQPRATRRPNPPAPEVSL